MGDGGDGRGGGGGDGQTAHTWPSSTPVPGSEPRTIPPAVCLPIDSCPRDVCSHSGRFAVAQKDVEPFSNQSSKEGKALGNNHKTNCRPCRRRKWTVRDATVLRSCQGEATPHCAQKTKIHLLPPAFNTIADNSPSRGLHAQFPGKTLHVVEGVCCRSASSNIRKTLFSKNGNLTQET